MKLHYCEDLAPHLNAKDRTMAWAFFQGLAKLAEHVDNAQKANEMVQQRILGQSSYFVSEFSAAQKEYELEKHQFEVRKLAMHIGLISAMIMSPLFSLAGDTAKVIAGVVSGSYGGGVAIGLDMTERGIKDEFEDTLESYEHSFSESVYRWNKMYATEIEDIFKFGLNSHGTQIGELVKPYITGVVPDPERTRDLADKQWMALAINQVWQVEGRMWITASKSENRLEDDWGPAELKICLPEEPFKVSYVYFLDAAQEGSSPEQ